MKKLLALLLCGSISVLAGATPVAPAALLNNPDYELILSPPLRPTRIIGYAAQGTGPITAPRFNATTRFSGSVPLGDWSYFTGNSGNSFYQAGSLLIFKDAHGSSFTFGTRPGTPPAFVLNSRGRSVPVMFRGGNTNTPPPSPFIRQPRLPAPSFNSMPRSPFLNR